MRIRRWWSLSGDVEKRTPGDEGVRPATPLPFAMEDAVVVCVVASHSCWRTSRRRLMFLGRAWALGGTGGRVGEDAPDEVELDDGLPRRALLVEMEWGERELEVWRVCMCERGEGGNAGGITPIKRQAKGARGSSEGCRISRTGSRPARPKTRRGRQRRRRVRDKCENPPQRRRGELARGRRGEQDRTVEYKAEVNEKGNRTYS